MERRKFIRNVGIGSLFLPLNPFGSITANVSKNIPKNIIIPKGLKPGDTIGIISPASAIFETEPYEIARESFEAMGLKVKFGDFTKSRYGHLAGTDEERAMELMEMFKNDEIPAIIAILVRSTAASILDNLYNAVSAQNPKIFIG